MRSCVAALAGLFAVAVLVGACDQPDGGGQQPPEQMPQQQSPTPME